jgi:hypothetical protein
MFLALSQPVYAHSATSILQLTPEDATNLESGDHTVTATITLDGDPVPGHVITFAVTGANNAGGTASTDSNGQATFTYTGAIPGDDTITATATRLLLSHVSTPVGTFHIAIPFGTPHTEIATKHWSFFVVPESPIGIIALMGASLGAFGGFLYWKRKQSSSQPHSIGDLGI